MDLSHLNIMMLIIGYPMLLLALTVHESAHAWTADRYGDPTARFLGRISLNPLVHIDIFGTVIFPILAFISNIPLIGWAKPVPVNPMHLKNPSRDNMYISLAGPISNLVLGALFFILFAILKWSGILYSIHSTKSFTYPLVLMVVFGVKINVLLAIFNIIPIPPLDGSHVIEYYLPYQWRHSWDMIKPYGFFIILGFFILGCLIFLYFQQ